MLAGLVEISFCKQDISQLQVDQCHRVRDGLVLLCHGPGAQCDGFRFSELQLSKMHFAQEE